MKTLWTLLLLNLGVIAPTAAIDTPWTARANMPTPRAAVAAVVLDDLIYVIGGKGAFSSSDAVEAYDPVTDTWATKAPLPTPRASLAATVVDGKIYTFGGIDYTGIDGFGGTGAAYDVVEIYDPATDTWTTGAPMPQTLGEAAIGAVGGKIYIVAGAQPTFTAPENIPDELVEISNVFAYDPATDTWSSPATAPFRMRSMGHALVGDKIHIIAGRRFPTDRLRANLTYDPATDTWEGKSAIPTALMYPAAAGLRRPNLRHRWERGFSGANPECGDLQSIYRHLDPRATSAPGAWWCPLPLPWVAASIFLAAPAALSFQDPFLWLM